MLTDIDTPDVEAIVDGVNNNPSTEDEAYTPF